MSGVKKPDHKVLIMGGERTGEWVQVLAGATGWVDIRTGTTHRIASLRWAVTDPGLDGMPVVTERYVLRMAVHPQIAADPASGAIVQQALNNLAVTELMRAHAERLPADADPEVPDTPAPLFGPDGAPL
jgi:hypothetical protein